jgi:hypothetical protein
MAHTPLAHSSPCAKQWLGGLAEAASAVEEDAPPSGIGDLTAMELAIADVSGTLAYQWNYDVHWLRLSYILC